MLRHALEIKWLQISRLRMKLVDNSFAALLSRYNHAYLFVWLVNPSHQLMVLFYGPILISAGADSRLE